MMNDSAAFRKLLILSWALIEGDDGTEVNPLPGRKLRQVRRGLMCVLSHLSSPACTQLWRSKCGITACSCPLQP